MHVSALEWTPEDNGAKAIGPMVAAIGHVDLGSSPKLTTADNDCRVQKISILQQSDQRSQSWIEDTASTSLEGVVFDVRVPAAKFDFDASDPLLNQADRS